jgi:6-phosphofructokinase 1
MSYPGTKAAKTIAVLTSGGDAPGMNAALRAIVKVAASRGVAVVGVEEGYTGLLEGKFRLLTRDGTDGVNPIADVDLWGGWGGTILGSAREMRMMSAEGRQPAVEQLQMFDGLVVIGGNGSLAGAHALAAESSTPIVGVPASIDHDVGCTGTSIGVDTALNTIVTCCDRISDTARAHHRAFVVEVMGRHCGYLAMASAVAAGAEAVLFREQGRDQDEIVDSLCEAIKRAFRAGRDKRRVLILKAEGVNVPCQRLVRLVQERLAPQVEGVSVRATVLGHVVRGGSPSFQDRMVSGRLGLQALEAAAKGKTDVMAAWQPMSKGGEPTRDPAVQLFGLQQVLDESASLIDGTSPLTQRRVQMMEEIEGVLGL